MTGSLAKEHLGLLLCAPFNVATLLKILDQPDPTDHRRRGIPTPSVSLYKRHVPAHDWELQHAASFGHPLDRLHDHPHRVGFFWVAEIEIVGDRDWRRANRTQIAIASATACLPTLIGSAAT